jgi:pseudaminic acid biosynthesis-associated methylase
MDVWNGDFGRDYTDRNAMTIEELDALYEHRFGCTRRALNEAFLGALPRDLRILEVGANVGNQLLMLQAMGFTQLYGIELQAYALELAKQRTRDINLLEGSAFDLPFKDRFFDLVFTSGVLIHLAPSDLDRALDEIVRCTRRYVWGMEYFSERHEEIRYRGNDGLLWKGNFAGRYLERCPRLRLLSQRRVRHAGSDSEDAMFLLELR